MRPAHRRLDTSTMTKTIARLTISGSAIAAACGTFALLRLAGVDLAVRAGAAEQRVTLPSVVLAATVAALAGWALLAVLERLTARARTWWTVIATAVFLLSLLAGPPGGITAGAVAGLALLHLTVAVVLIAGLRRSAR